MLSHFYDSAESVINIFKLVVFTKLLQRLHKVALDLMLLSPWEWCLTFKDNRPCQWFIVIIPKLPCHRFLEVNTIGKVKTLWTNMRSLKKVHSEKFHSSVEHSLQIMSLTLGQYGLLQWYAETKVCKNEIVCLEIYKTLK